MAVEEPALAVPVATAEVVALALETVLLAFVVDATVDEAFEDDEALVTTAEVELLAVPGRHCE